MTDGIEGGERAERNKLALTLTAAAGIAGVGAFFATGGLAVLAGAIAVICLAGSVLANAAPGETPFDEYCQECDERIALASENVAVTQSREAVPGTHWRQTIAADRQPGRRR